MVEKRAKNGSKPELWPAIRVDSLGGSLENLDFLLGCQGHSQKAGKSDVYFRGICGTSVRAEGR